MKWLVTLLFVLLTTVSAGAQTQPVPSKIDDLVRLLQDPEVRTWLENQKPAAAAQPAAQPAAPSGLPAWELATRKRINAIVSAVPRIPGEVASASMRVRQDAISHGYAPVMLIFAGLVVVGAIAERLFRRLRPNVAVPGSPPRALSELLPLAVFAAAMAVIFFAVEWPPLARIVLLTYLIAFVVYRFASALADIACLGRKDLLRRVRIVLGTAIFGAACASLAEPVGLDPAVATAIAYCFSVVLLLLAIEMVWRTSRKGRTAKLGLTAFLVAAWVLWCLDLRGLFWICIYALILPGILRSVGRSVEAAIPSPPNSRRSVLLVRGSRAIVVALAAAWIGLIWQVNPNSLAHQNPALTRILYGLLKSVIVLLLADLVWHLARAHIDRTLATSADTSGLSPADMARRSRLRTLLPIIRNGLAAMVAVMAGLIVLSELGVEIGPLIAGAGIFGVAIGFGSQTLVKDVISGVFYMLDDAFRVGEYIQAKNYKGTVEGFSLRSVRLRHHRGPVFTIPFGELGAVENMSRDWVIDKFRISVGYNTDIAKARKITKAIGAELQADPEVGPLFIEPLKMKGVEEFGDYGIVLSFAMTTVPGQQTYIRRKAYAMIRDAFKTNGIEFAQPTVQVGGEDKGGGAAAATAVRATQLKQQAPEGE
jgi:small-conductance mechanosensitive channel